jgi:hypothetical protein
VLAFTYATTSAAKNALLFCSLIAASSASVVGSVAGAGNVNASATPSPGAVTLTTPLLIISIISSKPAFVLVSAVALSATSVSAAT